MSLPSIVFIVASDKHEVFVGYTKDLEVTLSLIADGRYDASLAARGLTRLVHFEELPTVREAIARVDEINAMSPSAKRKLVEERNAGWSPLSATGVVRPTAERQTTSSRESGGPRTVYIVANVERDLRFNTTEDLLQTLIRIRAAWAAEPNWTLRIDRLVYYEELPSAADATKRIRAFKRMGTQRLRDLVTSFNRKWDDVGPKRHMVPAAGAAYGPTRAPEREPRIFYGPEGDGPDAAEGGVTADLPRAPRAPDGARAGRYEEPWPVVEE